MKRAFKQTPQWARYKHRKELLRKNRKYVPNPDYERQIRDRGKRYLTAPQNFSLIENTSEVIEYFRSIYESAHAHVSLVMDMSSIKKTDLATIALLISIMMDRRKSNRDFRQYTTVLIPPVGTEPGLLFRKAQFHETVTAKGIADHTFFLSRLAKKVNEDYIRDTLKYAEKFLKTKNPGKLAPLLVEIISNTNNHANPNAVEEEDKLPWFLAVLEDDKTGKMIFSVVDLGVGIYESLRIKGLANEVNFEDSIKSIYQNSQGRFLRTNIPQGVDSSTGLFYRGKGLQSVYNYAKEDIYDKFRIITNRANINLKSISSAIPDAGESLGGTVYYWEMSTNE